MIIMAEKKFLDQNGLLYVWSKIKTELGTKVDKVDGMGLSHNDLTDELVTKINNAGDSSFSGAYSDLTGKPKINNVELGATNSLADLGIQAAGDYATNTALANKVDKVDGKGLSTNDYTDADKAKLTGIATGAQANVIETIKVNGVAETVTDKAVDITVPTKLSELTNDGNFVTDASYVHTDNNYTNADKTKLAGIDTGAEENVLEGITVNGTAATITNKIAAITTPTKVSQLTNDSKFQTDTDVSSAITTATANFVTGTEVDTKIATAKTGLATETWVNSQLANINKKSVVTSTSQMTDANTIYLMANGSSETNNIYDEYIVIKDGSTTTVEKIGTTEVDLTNYLQTTDLVAITNAEIDTIFAS